MEPTHTHSLPSFLWPFLHSQWKLCGGSASPLLFPTGSVPDPAVSVSAPLVSSAAPPPCPGQNLAAVAEPRAQGGFGGRWAGRLVDREDTSALSGTSFPEVLCPSDKATSSLLQLLRVPSQVSYGALFSLSALHRQTTHEIRITQESFTTPTKP